jgi:hypothetical protein
MAYSYASNSNLRGAQRGAALSTATSSFVGVVRVDGNTMLVDANGTISADFSSVNSSIANLSSVTATNIATLSSNVNTRLTNVTSQTITTTSLTIGSSVSTLWNFVQSSNGSLYLYFNGVAKFRFDTSGTITATNDIIAVGTI